MSSKQVAVTDGNANGGAVAERDPIRAQLSKLAPELRAALPPHVSPEKFTRVALTAINSNPDLRQADPRSLFGSIVKLAQDGLLPDGREAALVIFNAKRGDEWVKSVQAMPMISGLLKMMRQSGEVAWIDAHVVRTMDKFQYRPGLDEVPIFEPNWFGDRGPVVGVYAIARLKSGETVPPEIMSLAEIEKVRSASRAGKFGPWNDWFEQMALKTVLRRYLKRLPTSTDIMAVLDRDETMQVRGFEPVQQIEADPATGEILPQRTSRLVTLASDVADAPQADRAEYEDVADDSPPPAQKTRRGRPARKADEATPDDTGEAAGGDGGAPNAQEDAWIDEIDRCTNAEHLTSITARFQKSGLQSERVEGALRSMGEALKGR